MPNFKKFGKANNFYFPYKIKKELKSQGRESLSNPIKFRHFEK